MYNANHATFPIWIRKITVQICGNFWVTQYLKIIRSFQKTNFYSDQSTEHSSIITFLGTAVLIFIGEKMVWIPNPHSAVQIRFHGKNQNGCISNFYINETLDIFQLGPPYLHKSQKTDDGTILYDDQCVDLQVR